MSYEGYSEFLCAKGHYSSADCYASDPTACGFCGSLITHYHAVDGTNGIEYADYDEDNKPIGPPLDYTVPAPLEEIGFDDDWKFDHHGNKYSRRVPRYKPTGSWRSIKTSASSARSGGTIQENR